MYTFIIDQTIIIDQFVQWWLRILHVKMIMLIDFALSVWAHASFYMAIRFVFHISIMLIRIFLFIFIFIFNLWCQVESYVSNSFDCVFQHKWHIRTHHEWYHWRKRCCFGEEAKIFQCECRRNIFLQLDLHLVFLIFHTNTFLARDRSRSHITINREFDAIFGHRYTNRTSHHCYLSTNAFEFRRGHDDGTRVFHVRNTQLFYIDVHQPQSEMWDTCTGRWLKHKFNLLTVLLHFHCDNIIWRRTLKNFGQAAEIDAEADISITTIVLESITTKKDGNKGYVWRIQGWAKWNKHNWQSRRHTFMSILGIDVRQD